MASDTRTFTLVSRLGGVWSGGGGRSQTGFAPPESLCVGGTGDAIGRGVSDTDVGGGDGLWGLFGVVSVGLAY